MILNNIRKKQLNEYLQKKYGMYDYRRGWLKGDCPYCGEHKFGVNIGQNRSNCFKCGHNPTPISLVFDKEKITTYVELYRILDNLEGITFYEEAVEVFEIKRDNVLPDGYRNIRSGESILAKAARKYLEKRGFNLKELSRAGFGYCTKGKYMGYIIMPFYYNNLLVYFNARLYMGNGPKFNNPDIEDFGIGKSFIIYNRDALYIYNRIFIVESVTNARTIGDNAIGMGGKALSSQQINDIIKSPCEKVIIGLDRDAIDYAIKLAFELIDYKKVKIMIMPTDDDINKVGRKKSLIISYKSKYLNYKTLQQLKNEYC